MLGAVGWKQFMALLTLGSLCWGMEAFMEWHKKANEGAWQNQLGLPCAFV